MFSESFLFKTDTPELSLIDAVKDIRKQSELFDVTIVCDDNQIKAHKLILSAGSTMFRRIFVDNPDGLEPIFILRNVKSHDFSNILNFMYGGETIVNQEDIEAFINIGAELEVKGLVETELNSNKVKESCREPNCSMNYEPETIYSPEFPSQSPSQSPPPPPPPPLPLVSIPSTPLPEESDSSYYQVCEQCHQVLKNKKLLKRHMKKHAGVMFPCNFCHNTFNRKDNLVKHSKKSHNMN